MTVAELIEALRAMPPEVEIYTSRGAGAGHSPVVRLISGDHPEGFKRPFELPYVWIGPLVPRR